MPIVALWASGEAEFFNVSFQLSFHTASADSGNTAHHHVAMIIVRRVTALPPEASVRKKFGVQFP